MKFKKSIKYVGVIMVGVCIFSSFSKLQSTIITLESNQITLENTIDKYIETVDSIDILQDSYDEEIQQLKRITNETTFVTQNELSILNRIVEAEATSGTIQQKINVAKCIQNRVLSNRFPDDIESVVFQHNQFQPTFDGRYESVVVTKDTRDAVQIALRDSNNNRDATFFMARSASNPKNVNWFDAKLEFLFNDGIHDYFVSR